MYACMCICIMWVERFLTQDRRKTVTCPMYSITLSICGVLLTNNMYINKAENNMKRLFVLCLRHTLLYYSML